MNTEMQPIRSLAARSVESLFAKWYYFWGLAGGISVWAETHPVAAQNRTKNMTWTITPGKVGALVCSQPLLTN
jgi:hypothetical protein